MTDSTWSDLAHPDNDQPVLIVRLDHYRKQHHAIAFYRYDGWALVGSGYRLRAEDVVCWQPLPQVEKDV